MQPNKNPRSQVPSRPVYRSGINDQALRQRLARPVDITPQPQSPAVPQQRYSAPPQPMMPVKPAPVRQVAPPVRPVAPQHKPENTEINLTIKLPSPQKIKKTTFSAFDAFRSRSQAIYDARPSMPPIKRKHALGAISGVLVLSLCFGVGYLVLNRAPDIRSGSNLKQASAAVTQPSETVKRNGTLIPADYSGFKVDETGMTYNQSTQVLSFSALHQSGYNVLFNEQPLPTEIKDNPNGLAQLATSLNSYYSFPSKYGTVYLTRPKQVSGQGQVGLVSDKDVLAFIKPGKDLTNDEWLVLIENLVFKQ